MRGLNAGLNAELLELAVRGAMSGSGERHALYFYVHPGRLVQGPIETWWQACKARARLLDAPGVPHSIALECASGVLNRATMAGQGGLSISDMCTVSLFDTTILDGARSDGVL